MSKTASGLASYCEAQVGLPYWYGTYGQTADATLLAQKRSQYSSYYSGWNDFESQYGKRVHDCIGLVKGYLWSDTPTSTPVYNAAQDVNCQGMYDAASEKGSMATFPSLTGTLVFNSTLTHVGVYCNGYIVQARGHAYGVTKDAFANSNWSYWAKCPWVEYSALVIQPESGFSLAVDGLWGKNTTRAVQTILGTGVDGIVDSQYRGYASDNPGLLGESWMWVSYGYGSPMVRALQSKLGVSADGLIGPASIKALQNKYGTGTDGHIDSPSPCVKAMQTEINERGRLW